MPSITYTGPSTEAAIEIINCASCGVEGIFIQNGLADTAINIDMDLDVYLAGASIASGSTTLSYGSRNDQITPIGIGGRNLDAGRQVVVRNASNVVIFTGTLASANNLTNTLTLASPAPSAVSGGNASIVSPYPSNVSTSATLNHVRIRNNGPANVNWVGVRVAATSFMNNERLSFTDLIINGNSPGTADSFAYGSAITFGDETLGGGSNTLNLSVRDSYVNATSYGIKSYTSKYVATNNEFTHVTTVHDLTSSEALITFDRPEYHRQFVVARNSEATLIANNMPYGGWNSAYPVVYARASKITMFHNVYSQQEDIIGADADPTAGNSTFIGGNNTWPNFTNRPTFDNFAGGGIDMLSFSRRFELKGTNGVVVVNAGQLYGSGLPGVEDGAWIYCKDCLAGSTPCVQGGTGGAHAFKSGGVWKCPF